MLQGPGWNPRGKFRGGDKVKKKTWDKVKDEVEYKKKN